MAVSKVFVDALLAYKPQLTSPGLLLYYLMSHFACQQGINRLGKAPPRPGSLRPPDPNRNRVLDIYSEGTEGDADYMRMVQDVSSL